MKSQKSSDLETLKENLKKLYRKYNEHINDIILFGSLARAEKRPNDIDIAIIFTEQNEAIIKKVVKDTRAISEKIHFNWLVLDKLFESSLFPTVIEEGFSILKEKYIHEYLGYTAFFIFNYNLTNLPNNRKVLFSYALNGNKNNEGILKQYCGEKFGKTTVIIPLQYAKEFRNFLEQWDVKYFAKKALIK